MPFVKGQSGNPAGRPVGSRNKFTSEMQDALEECGLPLIQRLLELAGEGNTGAMRQCLDRLMGKHRPSYVQLPSPDTPDYVPAALTEIHRALGAGEIPSEEASRLVDFVGRTARVLASKAAAELDFDERLARCEKALGLEPGAGKPAAIDNNNTETTTPAPAEVGTEPPVIDNNNGNTMEASAALDESVRATLPRRPDSVPEQLMNSTASLAPGAGVAPSESAEPVPLASAA